MAPWRRPCTRSRVRRRRAVLTPIDRDHRLVRNHHGKQEEQGAQRPKTLNPRKFKKKTSVLVTDKVEYIDYKDVDLLSRFMSDRAKIRNRRVTGNTLQQQREIANAVKVAREMALLPYAKRVASDPHRWPRP